MRFFAHKENIEYGDRLTRPGLMVALYIIQKLYIYIYIYIYISIYIYIMYIKIARVLVKYLIVNLSCKLNYNTPDNKNAQNMKNYAGQFSKIIVFSNSIQLVSCPEMLDEGGI